MKQNEWDLDEIEVDGKPVTTWIYKGYSLEQDLTIDKKWRLKHWISDQPLGYSFDKLENAKNVVEYLQEEVGINGLFDTISDALEASGLCDHCINEAFVAAVTIGIVPLDRSQAEFDYILHSLRFFVFGNEKNIIRDLKKASRISSKLKDKLREYIISAIETYGFGAHNFYPGRVLSVESQTAHYH